MKVTIKIEGITKGSEAESVAEKIISAFHAEDTVWILGENMRVMKYETSHHEIVTTQLLTSSTPEYHPSKDRTAEFELYIVD